MHVSVQPAPADAGGDDVVRRGLKRPSRGHQEAISDTHLAMPPATTWSEEAIKRQSRGHQEAIHDTHLAVRAATTVAEEAAGQARRADRRGTEAAAAAPAAAVGEAAVTTAVGD